MPFTVHFSCVSCVRTRGNARAACWLFTFYLQMESRGARAAELSERSPDSVRSRAPPPLRGSGLRPGPRAGGGRATAATAHRGRRGGGPPIEILGPVSQATLRILLTCLPTHSTDSTRHTFPREGDATRTKHTSKSMWATTAVYQLNFEVAPPTRERRASRLSTGI